MAEIVHWRGTYRRRRRVPGLAMQAIALVLALGAGALLTRLDWPALANVERAALPARPTVAFAPTIFPACHRRTDRTCVVDGDTFRLDGEIIRIADIDTPEVHSPACPAEQALGERATARLTALLNAGPFALEPYERDKDRYGRSLRLVTRNGASLGALLVAEGLAHVWDGRKHPWC